MCTCINIMCNVSSIRVYILLLERCPSPVECRLSLYLSLSCAAVPVGRRGCGSAVPRARGGRAAEVRRSLQHCG